MRVVCCMSQISQEELIVRQDGFRQIFQFKRRILFVAKVMTLDCGSWFRVIRMRLYGRHNSTYMMTFSNVIYLELRLPPPRMRFYFVCSPMSYILSCASRHECVCTVLHVHQCHVQYDSYCMLSVAYMFANVIYVELFLPPLLVECVCMAAKADITILQNQKDSPPSVASVR
jgi:hypothetical protein